MLLSRLITTAALVSFGLLGAGSLSANDCCKYCGSSGYVAETTRSSMTCGLCYVTICTLESDYSTDCSGGSFPCDSATNDQCYSWAPC